MSSRAIRRGGANRWLFRILERIRTSFWAVPSVLAVLAVVLARLAVVLDDARALGETRIEGWLFYGSVADARAVLTTVAGSTITVAGVVLSMTMVALSFASAQIGPRLLRNFMRDRGNQLGLGCFLATYLYALLALSSIAGGDEPQEVFRMRVTFGLALAAVSFGVLIYFVHHVSSSMQVDQVVAAVRRELDESIEEVFAETTEEGDEELAEPPPAAHPFPVRATASGYVQAIDYHYLGREARSDGWCVRCSVRPGHYVVVGGELARLDGPADDEAQARLRRGFVLGDQRTGAQDVEHSIRQLVEVALRALSPGVNDPFTAVSCIDHLSASMACLVRRRTPAWWAWREDGTVRLACPAVTFAGAMDVAWNQLRQHGADQPAVAIRLLEGLERIAGEVRDPDKAESVRVHAERVLLAAEPACSDAADRRDLAERARAVEAWLVERGLEGARGT